MAKKRGLDFEELTTNVISKIVDPSVQQIERNIRIDGPDGKREIDILITYTTNGIQHRTIIECKDYNKPVQIEKLDAIASKMLDVKANKAVMITRVGYTRQAKAKAERLNIDLYTVHQALHPTWGIDIEIPVLVTEIIPTAQYRLIVPPSPPRIPPKLTFPEGSLIVNDMNLLKLFEEEWNNQTLVYNPELTIQEVKFSKITEPHYVRDNEGEKFYIKIEVMLTLLISYFLGNIKEIESSQLLKDSLRQKKIVILEDIPYLNYKTRFKKVTKQDIPEYDTLALSVNAIGKLSESRISSVEGLSYNQ